jgi:hypothetical protein
MIGIGYRVCNCQRRRKRSIACKLEADDWEIQAGIDFAFSDWAYISDAGTQFVIFIPAGVVYSKRIRVEGVGFEPTNP